MAQLEDPLMYVMQLLATRTQLKLFHWQTREYGAHIALGDAVDRLDDKTDKLAELALAGRRTTAMAQDIQGLIDLTGGRASGAAVRQYVASQVKLAQEVRDSYASSHPSLVYVMDEIVGVLLQLQYLLRFDSGISAQDSIKVMPWSPEEM